MAARFAEPEHPAPIASEPPASIAPEPRRRRTALMWRLYPWLLDRRDWGRLRLLVDVLVLYMAATLALLGDATSRSTPSSRWLAGVFPVLVVIAIRARRAPDDRLNASTLDTVMNVLGVVSLSVMLTISIDSVLGGAHALGLATRLWLFAALYLGIARATLVSARKHAIRSPTFAAPTLIVGAGVIGSHLARRLFAEPSYGLRPVAFLDDNPLPVAGGSDNAALPVLGGPDDLAAAVTTTGARHVILAFSGQPDRELVATVRECERLGVGVSLIPRLYESINERTALDHVGGLPLLTLNSIDPKGWQFALKHLIDRPVALLGLVALSPVLVIVAALVRVTSAGPALLRQRRVGRDGHEFDLLKFRTMSESDGGRDFVLEPGLAPGGVEGIDRRTLLGRWLRDLSIDELPQLINVVRGDMSMVGPRPERPEFAAMFARDVARYDDRHRVKSGITGWAQVHGLRGQTSIADRVEWDNYYITNWSLKLDIKIMLLTVAELLRFRDSQAARDRAADELLPVDH